MSGRSIVLGVTLFLASALATPSMAADDPFVGTWKLNVAKCKPVFLKSQIVKIKAEDIGHKCAYDEVHMDGKAIHGEYAAKYDGKDYPVTGDPDWDAASIRRINAHSLDFLWKKNGKLVVRNRAVISKDEKIWTDTAKAKNPNGPDIKFIGVYDKQ